MDPMRLSTSVVIPCYNPGGYLAEALASVCCQTLPVREIIMIDDGSTPPVELPKNWRGPTITLIRTKNRGAGAARNVGISQCSGDLVAFLDADDLWHPEKVEKQTRAFESNPGCVAGFTRCSIKPGFFGFGPYPPIDVSDDEFLLVLWYNNFFPPSATTVRRTVLKQVGYFRQDLGICEDMELWLRILRCGSFVHVPEPLCHYRRHSQQSTANLARKMSDSKRARKIMIEQHCKRLSQAGLNADKLWDPYRNDILLIYYRRDFALARRLLLDYLRDHPSDLGILKYSLISLFPQRIIALLRGTLSSPSTVIGEEGSVMCSWQDELEKIRKVHSRNCGAN
jgi:glycosyltransferase involved in cell wall biosynthesis